MTLSHRAMLVSLHQRIWSAAKADRSLAHRIEQETNANGQTMRVVKKLIPTHYLLPIKRVAELGEAQHSRLTLPGIVKGQQLLATRAFDEYALIQSQLKEAFWAEVDRFAEIYPQIIEMAPKRLGDAYDPSDYPEPKRIKSFFDYQIRFAPVPEGDNWFLNDVDGDALSDLRNEVENQKNEMFRNATKELMDRTKEILEKLAKQATEFDGDKNCGGMLRSATIDAVKDMAHLVSNMNITGDPTLETIGKEMVDNFSSLDDKELRNSAEARNRVAEITQRILQKMGA